MNALFLIVNSEERQRSFSKTFGSYPSCKVYMHIERLNVDFQQISEYAVADSPIWRQTAVRYAGPDKTRVDKNSYPLEKKGVNESSRELEAKR